MAAKADELTPMMRQYRRIRSELPEDALLLFRLGDFYEMFFEDAKIAAPILGVALTRRGGTPMCGVPYHALDNYLARLVRAGRKAAICEQVEDPATAKGIVRREVTRVVTPGTVIEEAILDDAQNNYLAALYHDGGEDFGLALMDLSTGAFWVEGVRGRDPLRDTLRRHGPSECLVGAEQVKSAELSGLLRDAAMGSVTEVEDWTLMHDAAREELLRHFKVHSLDGFGCEHLPSLVCAAGGLLRYVREELRRKVSHVRSLQVRVPGDTLLLDETTCANLDLAPRRGRADATTLLGVLDNTRTPMGARLLRAWVLQPAAVLQTIVTRHEAVGCLCENRMALNGLRDTLAEIRDLERLIARIGSGLANGRDLRALAGSLLTVPRLLRELEGIDHAALRDAAGRMHALPELAGLLDRALVESPPLAMKDGGLIREGYHAELDELRQLAGDGHAWLARFQAEEQERTGIKTLKVRHNKVFGYYIEVSKGLAGQVPDHYERRQTLVGAERFITPELKEYEQRIFGAQDRAHALETELFRDLRERAAKETAAIQETAAAIAECDVLASLADRALALDYRRPEMHDGDLIEIEQGRHAIVEQLPDAERFVPNDTLLDCKRHQIAIITGPNMAGKSTYIRQVALIAIMAHVGSFVPAASARISRLDRVFTRVGAGDDLARGRSTFLVEMQETANILNNATERSLIVLDEIGRGTSTFDGISIAWSVAEYLHNNPRVKAKTLFATHYHELTDLALTLRGVDNYSVQVREQGDEIVFLRNIVPGGADKSYGIHVARLAGLPGEVIDRAREILSNLEEGELESGQPKLARRSRRRESGDHPGQLTLFDL